MEDRSNKTQGETETAVPGALLNLSEVAPGECYPRALPLEVALGRSAPAPFLPAMPAVLFPGPAIPAGQVLATVLALFLGRA